jgi:hypothetical protein
MLTPALAVIARVAAEPQTMDPAEFLETARKLNPPRSCRLVFRVREKPGGAPIDIDVKLKGKLFYDGDRYYYYFSESQRRLTSADININIGFSAGGSKLTVRFFTTKPAVRSDIGRHTWILELTGVGEPKRLFKVLFIALNQALNSPQGHRFPTCTMWKEVDF